MTTAREIMTPAPRCVGENETLVDAARLIGADDDVTEVLETMKEHRIRRLPVIDGHDLVGIIAQADVALAAAPRDTGETVAEISE